MNTIVLQYPETLWVLPIALAVIVLLRVVRRRPFVAFPLAALLVPVRYRASRLRHIPTVVALRAFRSSRSRSRSRYCRTPRGK